MGPMLRRPNVSRATAVACVLAAALAPGGCSADATGPEPAKVTWTKVEMPAGVQLTSLGVQGSDLLVGGRTPGAKVVPRLFRIRPATNQPSVVPLKPESPYAFEAMWHSIASDGRNVLAIGGAPGGAHSNTRWTVWTGSGSLVEHPQEFNTFGGWGAGELVDAVMTPAGSLIVGSWASANAGLDIAIWKPSGAKWIRQPVASALQSSREEQVGVNDATASGESVVLAGSRLILKDVREQATVWRSTNLDRGWQRIELPDAGTSSDALSVRCNGNTCVIAGVVDGRLALWSLAGERASRIGGVEDIDVGKDPTIPAPVFVGTMPVAFVASDDQVKVVRGFAAGSTGPTPPIVDAAAVGGRIYLLAGNPAALWRLDATALN